MSTMDVRDAAISIWTVVQLAKGFSQNRDDRPNKWSWNTLGSWLGYIVTYSRDGGRKKKPVDVKKLVKSWVPIIRGLAVGHSKAEVDRCEFEAETHLGPLLTAPVAQVREFYSILCEALKNDPTIPFFVHTAFEAWHEVMLKRASDEGIKELKNKLAAEVAEMVEKDVAPDLKEALVGALRWRPAETLEKIKTAVAAGAKPRLQGRESCLFLVVKGEGADECVML